MGILDTIDIGQTYAAANTTTTTTGHYARWGENRTLCNRPKGEDNSTSATRLCRPCERAADEIEAAARGEQATPPAEQPAPATHAIRGAALKTTGHYRRPGTTELYCGRPAGARNGIFATVTGWKLCTRCVKAEASDRAEATATAEAWLDQPPTSQLAAAALLFGAQVEAIDNARAAGTWRSEWIGARTRDTAPTLFDVAPDTEQGALFA